MLVIEVQSHEERERRYIEIRVPVVFFSCLCPWALGFSGHGSVTGHQAIYTGEFVLIRPGFNTEAALLLFCLV